MAHPHTLYFDRLGVVQEGALADLSLVDGNPVESIETWCYHEK
jgi:imidazolonepropionase-like amidohydrolase